MSTCNEKEEPIFEIKAEPKKPCKKREKNPAESKDNTQ
jgi:hypothetical protein